MRYYSLKGRERSIDQLSDLQTQPVCPFLPDGRCCSLKERGNKQRALTFSVPIQRAVLTEEERENDQ